MVEVGEAGAGLGVPFRVHDVENLPLLAQRTREKLHPVFEKGTRFLKDHG
jgi:hypothetical protein